MLRFGMLSQSWPRSSAMLLRPERGAEPSSVMAKEAGGGYPAAVPGSQFRDQRTMIQHSAEMNPRRRSWSPEDKNAGQMPD